jgi:ParB/Sulfiredoxin domain
MAKTPKPPEPLREYTSHPITMLYPRMTKDEYADLKADLLANGQQVPILVIGSQIIDGRHRYEACRELGIPPKVQDVSGDPFTIAHSLNMRRRHLKSDQIAAFYARLRREQPEYAKKIEVIREMARERQHAALKQGKTVPRRGQRTPTGKTGRTATILAAEQPGTTETSIKRVARVEREHPERLPDIEAGTISAKVALSGTKPVTPKPAPKMKLADLENLKITIAAHIQKAWRRPQQFDREQIVLMLETFAREYRAWLAHFADKAGVQTKAGKTVAEIIGDRGLTLKI